MKYYKHPTTDEVYAFETEEERNQFGAPDLVEMTQAEVVAHLNPPIDPEQISDAVRAQRDALLAACDWVVVRTNELDLQMPQDWSEYRQALRDVPQQEGFPEVIEWPEPPK